MDPVPGKVKANGGRGRAAILLGARVLFLSSLLLSFTGCHWGQAPKPAYVPPPEPTAMEKIPPQPGSLSRITEEKPALNTPSGDVPPEAAAREPAEAPAIVSSLEPSAAQKALETPAGEIPSAAPAQEAPSGTGIAATREAPAQSAPGAPAPPSEKGVKPSATAAAHANGKKPSAAFTPYEEPPWALGKEELVYRVEFLGMTMGYARFTFKGKTQVDGKDAYHLSVRAWTSDILSMIYPINETIEYYMDVKTLEPLRQDFSGNAKKKADIAFYDQKKGRIVYRYKDSGAIRKEVDLVPSVFDPVTVAYYFRARDLGHAERPRNVYGGRKLYQISSRLLGREKIETTRGPVGTVVIQPVIMREGKLDDKGDLKMWMTDDSRHIPVRIYAKFRKIKMWTLYAELVPPKGGG